MSTPKPTVLMIAAASLLTLVVAATRISGTQAPARLALDFDDYAAMPITGDLDGANTRGLLARVNYMRDEPGGRRFFVNDLNGPLYIVDKQTKAFTTYLDFNGLEDRPGLFQKFTFQQNFATGLICFVFDPDYANNGTFYTLHMEDPSTPAPAAPRATAVAGLDLSGYETTPAIATPAGDEPIQREVVLIAWTDRDITNATFEGTARELMRLEHTRPIHPMGELTFNPAARPGDPDWRVMYIGSGDAGSGERTDVRRLSAQRLDTLAGKILRIVPDLTAHATTSTVSENGRYRIPNDNPFAGVEGASKEIWAYGLRNPHRLIWDLDPARPAAPRLLAFHIGLITAETIIVVHKGANYGWPLREGTRTLSPTGAGPLPENDTIPVQISDAVTRGTVAPTYPVAQYSHSRDGRGGDAIANGFIYTGSALPALRGKLLFGDITTGDIRYVDVAELRAADDGSPATLAPIHEVSANVRALAETTYRTRGGRGAGLPGVGAVAGRGRVDLRFAVDNAGELYVLTKSDGMIRRIVGARVETAAVTTPSTTSASPVAAATTAATANPVPRTAASIAAGKTIYDLHCAACHGTQAEGAVRARATISIIEESGGRQPPDLTDAQWDHGATDTALFTVIKRGVTPTMMAGYEGRIADQDIWHVVNYIRSLAR